MVSSNIQALPISHDFTVLPTRKRAGPGRMIGRWASSRTLDEPVCAGMWVCGCRAENMAVGEKLSWSAMGRLSSRAAVSGQRAQMAS